MTRTVGVFLLAVGFAINFGVCSAAAGSASEAAGDLPLLSAMLGFFGTTITVIGTVLIAGLRFSSQISKGFAEMKAALAQRMTIDECRLRHDAYNEQLAALRERISRVEGAEE